MDKIRSWDSAHKNKALEFAEKVTPLTLFEMLHSMRRWYSGQTMARKLDQHHDALRSVMDLEPADVGGVFRGFKVPKDHALAKVAPGDILTMPVTRNHGVSSWSLTEAPTNRFSGASRSRVGLIVKLIDSENIKPLLAPPEHTEDWFNALYAHVIGHSFRPKEQEYLVSAPSLKVEVVRVKKAAAAVKGMTRDYAAGSQQAAKDLNVSPAQVGWKEQAKTPERLQRRTAAPKMGEPPHKP